METGGNNVVLNKQFENILHFDCNAESNVSTNQYSMNFLY